VNASAEEPRGGGADFERMVYAQRLSYEPVAVDDIIAKFGHLSPQRLFETAALYEAQNIIDTAMFCCNLIINAPIKENDTAGQRLKIRAINKSAVLYYYMYDYRKSYSLLIRALDLCDRYGEDSTEYKIYANIGNIYYNFKEYGHAKRYYSKALELSTDSLGSMVLYNNIGDAENENGELDSALYHIGKSLQMSRKLDSTYLHLSLNTTASIYRKRGLYDSAFHYLHSALDYSRRNRKVEFEAENLADLGELFFEVGKIDSAIAYIDSSNGIAHENKYYNILLDNYLTLSRMEELQERYPNALDWRKRHSTLNDSLSGAGQLLDLADLRRIDEMSQTNRRLEELGVEQQVKERIINYQRIVLMAACVVLVLLAAMLLIVFFQKRRLNKTYKVLFDKNIEIISLQESSPEKHPKPARDNDKDDELLDRILAVMEDMTVISDAKFSINMLSSLVQANHTYVSQVINNTLHKNFRSFLNEYRIRAAQRLLSEPDAAKYTIESVSTLVGYRSRSTFHAAFQEITGVSPGFYLKSIQEKLTIDN
jgi:AraC-like DNA-binding protein